MVQSRKDQYGHIKYACVSCTEDKVPLFSCIPSSILGVVRLKNPCEVTVGGGGEEGCAGRKPLFL